MIPTLQKDKVELRLSTLSKNLSWTLVELELPLAVCLQSCGLNDTVS